MIRPSLRVERYSIEAFWRHASDIRGCFLEIGEDTYTRRFGGPRVNRSEVVHYEAGHPGVTIVDDLAAPTRMPVEAFDCIAFPNTPQFIHNVSAAVRTLYKHGADRWGDFWRFTPQRAKRLFGGSFHPTRPK